MEIFLNKFIIPKGTLLKSFINNDITTKFINKTGDLNKNIYFSYFIGENITYKKLYEEYYHSFSPKCNDNKLNFFILTENIEVLKWPDDLYISNCLQTKNEEDFISKLLEITKKKYNETADESQKNKYLSYLSAILELFNECNPQNIEEIETLLKSFIQTKDNPDYVIDILFAEYQLNGWLRFNQAAHNYNNHVDEIMLTNTFLNNNLEKIKIIMSIDCNLNKLLEDSNLNNVFNNLDTLTLDYHNSFNKEKVLEEINKKHPNPYPVYKDSYTNPDMNYNFIYSIDSEKDKEYQQKYLKYKQKYLKLKTKLF
jgi:hypothetical protein